MYDYRNEVPDGLPDWYHEKEARKEAFATLLNIMRTPEGFALLSPWTNAPYVGFSFSRWLEESRKRGFREGLPSDSAKRIFAEKVKTLVEEGFIIRTIEGYSPAPGIQRLLLDSQETL